MSADCEVELYSLARVCYTGELTRVNERSTYGGSSQSGEIMHMRHSIRSSMRYSIIPRRLSSYLSTVLMLSLSLGCIEDPKPSTAFEVTRVTPSLLVPGESVTIQGRKFDPAVEMTTISSSNRAERRSVAISGRALTITSWSDTEIIARIPLNVGAGERSLVVSRQGEQSPPFSVTVEGDTVREIPREGDAGVGPTRDRGVTPPPQDEGVIDMAPPVLGPPITVTLDDPNAVVVLGASWREFQGSVELWVDVIARDPRSLGLERGWDEEPLWGAAAQLDYPVDQLDFVMMAEAASPKIAAYRGEVEGRIYWYHGQLQAPGEASEITLMTLRFAQLVPNDLRPIRLSFTPRHSSLRGLQNQHIAAPWSDAQITFNAGDTP